jgi:glutathione synthase/RimK-type ligase-like ATP-grasp enzyme
VTAIGVFCARVRVEEKEIIVAAGNAGVAAVPVLPASRPLPPGPASSPAAMLGALLDETAGADLGVLVDRSPNRPVAATVLHLARLGGVRTIDAGLAATGTRVQVATALAVAGIPRPACLVGFSEASGIEAANQLGYPVTLFGLYPGSSSTPLQDADTADAVIEHRVVLGVESEAIVLLQAGAPAETERTMVHVVGGQAVATSGAPVGPEGIALAERAARALDASLAAVEVARTADGLVVWDVLPVADFRKATPVDGVTIGEAIARLALSRADEARGNGVPMSAGRPARVAGEAKHGVALSA